MLVLGIDPGSNGTGYGLVQSSRGRLVHVGSGIIRTKASEPVALRLKTIYLGLIDVFAEFKPEQVAIEAIFHHKSSESAIRLGQARGVALLAASQSGFEPFEYNPSTVKSSVGAHGRADKDAVARIVRLLLGIPLDVPTDQTDALAIAITHCAFSRTASLRSQGSPS